MVAMDLGSLFDFGIPFDQIVLGVVIGVLFLAIYEGTILITALLATRSERRRPTEPSRQ